jgi:hypothetical protein
VQSEVQVRPTTRQLVSRRLTHRGLDTWLFILLLLFGLALRLLLARTTWRQPDSDEATGMIMALQASRGHLSLLFWGGDYGGTVMTWIEAPLILIFGFSLWLFWVVTTAVTLVGVLIFRAVARRVLPPVAAAAAAGSFWFFPATWVFWSSREYVFWLPSIVFALAACLFVFRWSEHHQVLDLYALGLCTGLAIWSYPLVASLLIPALAIFVFMERRQPLNMAKAGAAALVGVAPWLAYFVVHGRKAFTVQQTGVSSFTSLRHTVTQVLPTTLFGGQKRFGVIWATPTLSPHKAQLLGAIVVVAVVFLAVVFVLTRRAALAACAVSFLLWPLIVVIGHVPVAVATFRYGLIALPPLLLLGAYLLSLVRAGVLLAALALLSSTWIAVSDTSHLAAAPGCNASIRTVDSWLVGQHRPDVWASYWLAGTMEVCGYPHVVASAVAPIRDHAAELAAERAPASTYVVFSANQLDDQLAAWVRSHPGDARRVVVAGYAIYAFGRALEPAQMQLVASAF